MHVFTYIATPLLLMQFQQAQVDIYITEFTRTKRLIQLYSYQKLGLKTIFFAAQGIESATNIHAQSKTLFWCNLDPGVEGGRGCHAPGLWVQLRLFLLIAKYSVVMKKII